MPLIRTCPNCGGMMNACYAGADGWRWCCPACSHEALFAQEESTPFGWQAGMDAFEAFNLYRYNRFDAAAEKFEALSEREDAAWPFLWNSMLSRYGIKYCSEQHTPVLWKKQIDARPITETAEYQKLIARAIRYDSATVQYYTGQAQLLSELQAQALRLQSGLQYDVFISYSSHHDDSNRFGSVLKEYLEIEHKKKNNGKALEVFFANDTLAGQTVNLFEAHIHRALSTARRLVFIVAPENQLGKRVYPPISEWMRNEYERFVCMHGAEHVRIYMMPGADVSMLDPAMRNIQIHSVKSDRVEEQAKLFAMELLLQMASEAVTANASAQASVPAQATVPVAMPAPASAGASLFAAAPASAAASLFAAAPAPVPAASDIPALPETKPVSTPSEKPQEDPVKQRLYLQATKAIEEAGSSVYKWKEALNLISAPALQGYRDVAALRARTSARYNELSRESSKKGKRKWILAVLLAVVLAVGITVFLNSDPADKTSVKAKATATNGVGTQNNKKQSKVKTGDIVTLGHYEQDNDVTNGKEPIEWQVLDVQGNNALLISKYGLDAQPYNTEWTDITWEKCTLRSWLNSTFLNAAFTAEEQKGILTTAVDNSKSQGYWSTDGGNNTKEDKIFLLSYAEANKYFGVQHYSVDGADKSTASRVAPTAYAFAQGAYTKSDYKTSEGKDAGAWWLRSPGGGQNDAAFVRTDGSLSDGSVDSGDGTVRPAFWLDLDKCVIENTDAGLSEVGSAEENSGNIKKPEEAGAKEGRSAFMTVGNVVTYGHYEQDDNTKNGKEPIEWIVLDVQGNKALLISKYGLDAQPYNTEKMDVTWETCTLRSWLNSTFLNAAFTAEEQKGILTTTVDNSKSQGYFSTNGGNNTQNRIFLLSYAEANKYFKVTYSDSKNTASRVAPTAYAIAQGAGTWSGDITSEGKAAGHWWLRSPGGRQDLATGVFPDGSLTHSDVDYSYKAVRPAFWLDLDKCVIENTDAGLSEVGSAEENSGNIKKPEEAGAKEGRSAFMTVGNVVTYGHYEQDNNTKNGKEPIEWIVLDVQGNKALLISKYGLDAQPYNTEQMDVTWETCTLRSWLNSTFLNAAFTAEEQKGILTTTVDNSKAQGYSDWDTDGGNNTQDQIFLLSYAEANKYFGVQPNSVDGAKQNTASRVAPTAYAIGQEAYTNSDYKTSEGKAAGAWWLRSPSGNQCYAAFVITDGSLNGLNVNYSSMAVRPAFWLDLDNCVIENADAGLPGVGSAEENSGNMKKPEEAGAKEGRSAFMTVGNVVTYGHYEQDNNTKNGKEPIEWQVLDVQGNKALLISKYGLDAQPYNTEFKDITWETCSLRSWLNSTFLNAAFTAEEQKGILTTAVDNSKAQGYSDWNTDDGNNTQDQIFLLSYAEANKYFGVQHCSVDGANQNTASRVAPTAYAIAQWASTRSDYKTSEGKAAGYWWLRSPGDDLLLAAYVRTDGALYSSSVLSSYEAVRPAFWLDLSSDIF